MKLLEQKIRAVQDEKLFEYIGRDEEGGKYFITRYERNFKNRIIGFVI